MSSVNATTPPVQQTISVVFPIKGNCMETVKLLINHVYPFVIGENYFSFKSDTKSVEEAMFLFTGGARASS